MQERAGRIGYEASAYPADVQELQCIWDDAGSQDSILSLSKKYKHLHLIAPDGADGNGRSWAEVFGWEYTSVTWIDSDYKGEINVDVLLAEILRS